MVFDTVGTERKLVIVTFVFVFLTFMSMGVFMERSVAVSRYGPGLSAFEGDAPVEYTQIGEDSNTKDLKAIVKGSIYETGSNMTVYGACFDGDGYLLPEAEAQFTAWYPNGSIVTGPNASMDPITEDFSGSNPNGTGRWKIHVTMGDTIGTYLTEMRCILDDEWAVSFGEWQNPEWVARIGDIDLEMQNLTSNLDEFRNDAEQNFTSVLNDLDTLLNADSVTGEELRELGESLRALDSNAWTIDESNPFFVIGSGTHELESVDMLSKDLIAAASTDGYYVYWDGETWNEVASSYEYRGVSLLPANQVYGWAVGTNGTDPLYAVNGGNATYPSLPSGTPNVFNDVELFQDPLNPSANFYAFLLGDDGTVYESNDTGSTWSDIGSVDAGSDGRFSQVVENYNGFAQPNGYMLLGGQGSQVFSYDGASFSTYAVNGTVADTALLYSDLGYVASSTNDSMEIYKWNGASLELEFYVNDSSIKPTGIEIHTQDDVWVSTRDPGTFFHFDGRKWEYSTFGYSEFVSVVISLGGGNVSTVGVRDMTMSDSRHGYAVGGDGLILEYRSEENERFDTIIELLGSSNATQTNLSEQLEDLINITSEMNSTLYNNQISINQTLSSLLVDIQNSVSELNVTMLEEFYNVSQLIKSVNASLSLKIDNVLNNVTYTQLYLETTITPLLNDTYQNTLLILQQLGIIEQTVNETRTIANETRSIVNESAQDIDELVNRSRRIRAWITQ